MKNMNEPLKNVVAESELKKSSFQAFLNHFNTLKKKDRVFYSWDDRNVDYNALTSEAKQAGIKDIPTETELQGLV